MNVKGRPHTSQTILTALSLRSPIIPQLKVGTPGFDIGVNCSSVADPSVLPTLAQKAALVAERPTYFRPQSFAGRVHSLIKTRADTIHFIAEPSLTTFTAAWLLPC